MVLNFEVNKKLETVYEYLSDMDKFSSVHPIISKIESKGDESYKVYETLKFWVFPFRFTYPVKIYCDKDSNKVTMKATVFKLTKIELNFSLSESQGVTTVQEIINFDTPLPIKGFLKKVFTEQHQQLFKNISKP